MNKDANDKKSKKSTKAKTFSTLKFARLLYRGAKFRTEPHPESRIVYETQDIEVVSIIEEYENSN